MCCTKRRGRMLCHPEEVRAFATRTPTDERPGGFRNAIEGITGCRQSERHRKILFPAKCIDHSSGVPRQRGTLCLCGERSCMGLFESTPNPDPSTDRTHPLADRMRPRTLDEFAGQEHLVAAGKPAAAPRLNARRSWLAHLLGTSRHRQDHLGANHRPAHQGRIHRILRRAGRNQGNQAGHGRRRTRPAIRHSDHCFH